MTDDILVNGIILKVTPVGDYDKRLVILTKEKGKISCFARGARRPNGKLAGICNPFCFGTFTLIAARDSYTLTDGNITQYFDDIKKDMELAFYATYFMELSDYYTRENNDEMLVLKLLYLTLRALESGKFDKRLVRAAFELKLIVLEGEFNPNLYLGNLLPSTEYAVSHIMEVSVEKLYQFTLTEPVLLELVDIAKAEIDRVIDRELKSLKVLNEICFT